MQGIYYEYISLTIYQRLLTYIQSFIIDLNKNQKYAFDSKSYFIRESNSQDKSRKFDDSVHLKYCLYMAKYGHWRLSVDPKVNEQKFISTNGMQYPDLLLY